LNLDEAYLKTQKFDPQVKGTTDPGIHCNPQPDPGKVKLYGSIGSTQPLPETAEKRRKADDLWQGLMPHLNR
jgi:hypothetical protein